MKQNRRIAVTGGIGSGKTLFCAMLKNLGYAVYSCDEIYGELTYEPKYLSLLQEHFPDCFVNGKLDKKLLAERVFSNADDKKTLEALAHPLIMQRLLKKMERNEIAFAEVPLLFEGEYEGLFDRVIALVRDREKRIEAVKRRSGLTETEIFDRMNNQFDPSHLSEKDCLIVENDGSEEDLKQKIADVLSAIEG